MQPAVESLATVEFRHDHVENHQIEVRFLFADQVDGGLATVNGNNIISQTL